MISCDTIYQRVLALANKEQRGYITPQEFNLFANMAQKDIYEQYFYDINQYHRLPSNGMEYSDILELLNEKISIFKVGPIAVAPTLTTGEYILPGTVGAIHTLGTVTVIRGNQRYEATEVKYDKLVHLLKSPLTRPTGERPIYYRKDQRRIVVFTRETASTNTVEVTYIREPGQVEWGYVVVNEKALYDPASSANFEIHRSDATELTFRIASYCGVTMKQPAFTQQTGAYNISKQQQEKI